jgi:tungstate transport system ATP-binding protein
MSALLAQLRGVHKSYGHRRVLDGIDLAIARGASYALTGDNGCGKTTLLRILAGLEPAQSGELQVNGTTASIAHYPEHLRRRIVYVHQHPYLFHSSVRHNVGYGLAVRSEPSDARKQKVSDAIAWAGMTHLIDALPHKLSGGESQRVALARAKVLTPELLLLDEPTANLDVDAKRHTIDLIERLRGESASVVVACHDRDVIGLPGMIRLHLRNAKLQYA